MSSAAPIDGSAVETKNVVVEEKKGPSEAELKAAAALHAMNGGFDEPLFSGCGAVDCAFLIFLCVSSVSFLLKLCLVFT